MPPPSAERRKQLVGQVKKMAEDAKVAIRNERRDANKHLDRLSSEISEDDLKRAKSRIDDLTKSSTDKVEDLSSRKTTEIEEI